MLKVVLSLGLALCTAGGALAQSENPQDRAVRELGARLDDFMRSCADSTIAKLDDRVSPAATVAEGTVSYCWKNGGEALFTDLSKQSGMLLQSKAAHRRTAHDYTLPLVLKRRVALQQTKG